MHDVKSATVQLLSFHGGASLRTEIRLHETLRPQNGPLARGRAVQNREGCGDQNLAFVVW